MGAEALARRLRTGPAPVVGRIERDRVLLDLRTVNDGELDALSAALRRALAPG
jgi:seryl-tRNA(Sec) selenium transferase